MSHQLLLIFFVIIFLFEFAAFGMQRATLLISREVGVQPKLCVKLLPVCFPAVWLVRIAKWILLFYIGLSWSWGTTIILIVVDFFLSTIVPIPYRAYIPSFRRRIAQLKSQDPGLGSTLEAFLNASIDNNQKISDFDQFSSKFSVRRISKVLGASAKPGFKVFNRPEDSWKKMDKAQQELFKICLSLNNLQNILQEYQVNDQTLKTIYNKLIDLGGSQWCGSQYVPVAALINPKTLEYLLKSISTSNGDYKVEREMVFTVVMYFQRKMDLPFMYNKHTDTSVFLKKVDK